MFKKFFDYFQKIYVNAAEEESVNADANKLLKDYKRALGFSAKDVLCPREGAWPTTFGVKDNKVVVLEQNCIIPHKYTVIGENPTPREPSDRFIKFEINGHEWQKIGRA